MPDHIGSVYVNVLPDADSFWREFRARTEPTAGETGAALGDPLGRRLGDTAGAEARRRIELLLRGMSGTATVRVDTAAADKQLHGFRSLLISMAPAVVPLTAAVAASGAALVSMGAAGVLAVLGVKREMKDGTATGVEYAQALATAKGVLQQLERTADRGALAGFDASVAALTAHLPFLNATMEHSSQVLGDVVSKLVSGTAGGLENFGPMIATVESTIDKLAGRFEAWATGPGGEKFADGMTSAFEQVGPALGSIASAVVKLIAAFAPSGKGALDEIGMFSDLVNEIPVDVLKAGTTAFVAFKAAVAVTAGIKAATLALAGFAAAEGAAAAGAGALGLRAAAGGMAAILARATPYVAGLVAVDFATRSLIKTNNSWAQSNNDVKSFIGNIGTEFAALARFDLKSFFTGSDIRENFDVRDQLDQIKSALDAVKTIAAETDKFAGPLQLPFFSNLPQARANMAALASAATAVAVQLSAGAVPLSKAADAYGDLTSSIGDSVTAQQKWLTQGDKTDKAINGVTIYTGAWGAALEQANGDATLAAEIIAAHATALRDDQAALQGAYGQQKRISDAVTAAMTAYKLTTAQVDLYGSAVGITADQLADGSVSQAQFTAAIGRVKDTVASGNSAILAFVGAVDQFNGSGKNAADTASLIGQTLKAYNGDALSYAGTLASANQAVDQVVRAVEQQNAQLSSGEIVYGDTERAALRFSRTTAGLSAVIDTTAAGAGDLITQLSGLQSAAMGAAQATYQHEVATMGAKQAADDAYNVYVSKTQGMLISQSGQLTDVSRALGLTTEQAKALSATYFGMPTDVKTKIEALGTDKVTQTLGAILEDLDKLSGGHHFELYADPTAVLNAFRVISTGFDNLQNHVGAIVIHGVGGSYQGTAYATGGPVVGAGTATSDSILGWLSNGEYVVQASEAAYWRPVLDMINYGGASAHVASPSPVDYYTRRATPVRTLDDTSAGTSRNDQALLAAVLDLGSRFESALARQTDREQMFARQGLAR